MSELKKLAARDYEDLLQVRRTSPYGVHTLTIFRFRSNSAQFQCLMVYFPSLTIQLFLN